MLSQQAIMEEKPFCVELVRQMSNGTAVRFIASFRWACQDLETIASININPLKSLSWSSS